MGYIINNGEKDYKKIAENWELAIGLQQVDNLVPSAYLLSVAKQNIDGLISYEEVQELLYHHYEKITSEEVVISRQKECDIVSARIAEYLNGFSFILSPETLRHMHEYLFKDIYDFAGKYRNYNLFVCFYIKYMASSSLYGW